MTTSRPWRTRGSDNGFSLIEVLVALVILSIGMLGLSRASVSLTSVNAINADRIVAASLIQDRLEAIKRAGYRATVTSYTEEYGTIANYSGYRRATTMALNTPATNMKTVTVTVSWQGNRHSLSASTILAQ